MQHSVARRGSPRPVLRPPAAPCRPARRRSAGTRPIPARPGEPARRGALPPRARRRGTAAPPSKGSRCGTALRPRNRFCEVGKVVEVAAGEPEAVKEVANHVRGESNTYLSNEVRRARPVRRDDRDDPRAGAAAHVRVRRPHGSPRRAGARRAPRKRRRGAGGGAALQRGADPVRRPRRGHRALRRRAARSPRASSSRSRG